MEKHNGLELIQQRVIYDEAAQPSTNHMKFQKKKLPREEQLEKKKKLEFLGEEQCWADDAHKNLSPKKQDPPSKHKKWHAWG